MSGTYKKQFKIASYDLNPLGKARLTSIANFFQEMAYTHAHQLGFGFNDMKRNQTMWVLSRMKIRISDYPGWNDSLQIETWHRGMKRIFGLRDFSMENSEGTQIGKASTAWLVIDSKTKRPVRPKDDLLNDQGNDKAVFERDPEKILLPGEIAKLDQRRVVYSDLDIVGHVNNVKYLEWSIDAAASMNSEIREIREIEINFVHEAHSGDMIEISQVTASEQEYFILARRNSDNREIFRTRLLWDQSGH